MVNYGIVGAGYFGADLARSMNKIEDAKVVAVFDPNHGEEVAQELGSDVCASLDELVAREDIDCVIVASPSYLHREPVVKAANMANTYFVKSQLHCLMKIVKPWLTHVKKIMLSLWLVTS